METTTALSIPSPVPTVAPVPLPTSTGSGCSNVAYGQCGGIGFQGTSCCPDGYYCKVHSDYFSQCWSCLYFPDPACSSSLLGSKGRMLPASRRHGFLATAMMQVASLVERRKEVLPTSDEL
jgi:hypothetical protein